MASGDIVQYVNHQWHPTWSVLAIQSLYSLLMLIARKLLL